MNKSALRTFAVNARKELLERVELQARKIGITKDKIEDASFESSDAVFINGKQLTDIERKQRNKLINRIKDIGFDQVMEETAYTWFNRFVALRFMEVNDYLPTKVRVLSSETEGSTEPDMIKEALSLDLPIDKEYIYDLKMDNNTEELFKYLIKLHCNDLNRYMPFMFETIEDYMAILFPEGLLGTDSFVQEMIDTEKIPEENWQQVEIIGWLYQYYIAEEKDKVFANLKKNIKITKETLPAATQLFTPHWIVRYMVENSLGKIWTESYPNSSLKTNWKYYLDEAEQEEDTIRELEEIRYKNVKPEEITFLDPACGSGHILVYAFDVFYDMYLEQGYMESEIPKLILEKNLYGLDVDDRAAQLASFAVLMRAREKTRRIFRQKPRLNIMGIQDTNWLTDIMIETFANKNEEISSTLIAVKNNFKEAKEYGSLIELEELDYSLLKDRYTEYIDEQKDLFEFSDQEKIVESLPEIFNQIDILNRKYDVVCTNPPYMGRNSMAKGIKKYLDKYYPNSNLDLFSAFIERGFQLAKNKGFNSMVTMQSWMFLSTFKKIRNEILEFKTINTLLHMDNMVMGIAFGTSATIFRNSFINDYKGCYTEVKYVDIDDQGFPKRFPIEQNRYGLKSGDEFNKIPGSPIAYWASEQFIKCFDSKSLSDSFEIKSGIMSGNDSIHLKLWFEAAKHDIKFDAKDASEMENYTWFPINKGGEYRLYFGNNEYIINLKNNGEKIKALSKNYRLRDKKYYFKNGITWSRVTSSKVAFRESNYGNLFGDAGPLILVENKQMRLYLLGLLTSKITNELLKFINPTLNYQVRDIETLPLITIPNQQINEKVRANIELSIDDWDSSETSWEFKYHPLINFTEDTIEVSFKKWKNMCDIQHEQFINNSKEINRNFIEIYGLQTELTPDVADEDVTIRKADLERDIKSFISYAVGCTFGRYSLDEEGLIYAGGEFDPNRYQTFPADENNILPILPGSYFEDDIVTRFINFVKVTYGEDTLEENLNFVADAIGRRKNETAREVLRRYFLNNFYKNHVQTYKKRPIYWLFTSGKEKAFNCLIYMHRYDKTTLSRIRTDYLHDVQVRYESEKKDLLLTIEDEGNATAKEIRDAKKELTSVERKIEELKAYDEKLHHLADMQIEIDLDDGVKVNYEKFKGLVAKI